MVQYLLLFLGALVSGVFTLTLEQCDQVLSDEVEYTCRFDEDTLTLRSRKNDYVRIFCEGTNYTCADIPRFDFASGLPLKSLGVSSCSPSLLRCVSDVIQATSVEVVTLTDMTGPLSREDVEGLGDVRVLMIFGAVSETSLPISVITTFPNLRHLRVGEGDFQLSPNIFSHSPPLKLEYLELRKDRLTGLPPGGLSGLDILTELNIWGNKIKDIDAGAFRGLGALKKLSFIEKSLRNIRAGVFSDTPLLSSIIIKETKLNYIPNGLLQGLKHLENITIQKNQEEIILDTQAFSQLASLKNIYLQECKIRTLPEGVFNDSSSIESLYLNFNRIENLPSKIFLNLAHLKFLDLSHNQINVLPKGLFAGLKNLEYLNLNRNYIDSLPDYLFSGPSNLKEVHIDQNGLTSIAWTSFQGAPRLETLSLASNKLTLEPDTGYQNLEMYSPFQYLTKLRKLDLSNNEIRFIFYDWRIILANLEYLDLSRNKFMEIECDQYQMQFLSKKVTIDLRYNNISLVTLDPWTPEPNNPEPTATMLLDHNPLQCDCHLYELKMRLDNAKSMASEPKFILDNARCHAPENLKSKLIKEISPKNLICDLPDQVPNNCINCVASVATNELVFNCQSLPSVLPDTKSLNFSYYFVQEPTITINLKDQPNNLNDLNIHKLNLSNTGLEKIVFSPSESLKILDLSNNNLKILPLVFLDYNISLFLSNNPFECDCGYVEELNAIQKYSHIVDYDEVVCSSGDKLSQIDVNSLCNTWKAAMAAVGTFVILGFFVFLATLITYRYSTEILIYITNKGLCRCCITEIQLDKDKEYDVFVSFAHQDLDIVQDMLLPKLENEFDQKVCVHYRDWVVGDLIPSQIIKSVENSRRTLILLSENFLESIWANLEFVSAHNLALKEGKARVILIILNENVLKHEKLSDELKAYVSTNTYLLWGDPRFWEKLQRVLPRIEHRITWLEALKHRSDYDKDGKVGLDVHLNSDGKLFNVLSKNGEEKSLPDNIV